MRKIVVVNLSQEAKFLSQYESWPLALSHDALKDLQGTWLGDRSTNLVMHQAEITRGWKGVRTHPPSETSWCRRIWWRVCDAMGGRNGLKSPPNPDLQMRLDMFCLLSSQAGCEGIQG